MDLPRHFQLHPVILLPLRPAPTHNNPQRRQIIQWMRPVGRKDRSIVMKMSL